MEPRVTFEIWRRLLDADLLRLYAITIADAGPDEDQLRQWWDAGDSPIDYVRFFANKYDLDPIDTYRGKISP